MGYKILIFNSLQTMSHTTHESLQTMTVDSESIQPMTEDYFCGMQAYMFKYDSTHGIAKADVHAIDDKTLQIGSQTIKVFGSR